MTYLISVAVVVVVVVVVVVAVVVNDVVPIENICRISLRSLENF